jgi:hypothetical protein
VARFAVGVVFGIVVGSTLGAALAIHASDADGRLVSVATDETSDAPDVVAEPTPEPQVDPQVECIIAKESGGRDVMNRQGSGATGPGQYMPSTWRAHTLEMGMPWLSIHNLADVRLVAAHDLALGRRRQWTVVGC